MARTTDRTETRAVAQAISEVTTGTASSQRNSVPCQRQRRQERHGFHAEHFKPAGAQEDQGGEQCSRAGGDNRPRRNNAVPWRGR